ncbi:MAG: hypothetical protein HZB31_08650 [Nitrospirae bacterium]|nr:hypothetical protein [Nitrospirota bacterium]
MSMPQGVLGNKYVAGAVGIALALVIVYNVQFFMTKNRPTAPAGPIHRLAPSKQEPAAQSPKTLSADLAQPTDKSADKAEWKRDPFSLRQAAGTGSKTTEETYDIKLMGIIKRDGISHALIDGKVYRVNDRIGKAVIKEITQHSIVLLAEGKKQEISFDDYKVIKEKKK